MTSLSRSQKSNIEGLLFAALQKAEETSRRAEEALSLLLSQQRPINFKAVAETAQISTAWLYAHEDIKMRLVHLRSQQAPKTQVIVPLKAQASTLSKDTMIAALQKRVREQAEKIKELEKQLEVAYTGLYQR